MQICLPMFKEKLFVADMFGVLTKGVSSYMMHLYLVVTMNRFKKKKEASLDSFRSGLLSNHSNRQCPD